MTEDAEDLVTVLVGQERAQTVPSAQEWPLDDVCAAAVDLARQALLDEADGAQVGEHLEAIAEGASVVTHYFAGHVPGYTGWRWAVTLTRAPDTDHVTVDETALLPDGTALLAPAWVPWKQRIESGDLGAGDVLVTEPDDARLVPGLVDDDLPEADEDRLRPAQWELGLGRPRMLSPEGRREAAHRWYREAGPRSPVARAADLECATCGFLLLIGGPLGQAFGVCANGYSPADGRVVAMTFGCGAHSETVERAGVGVADIVVDEVGYDGFDDVPESADDDGVVAEQSVQPDAPSGAFPAGEPDNAAKAGQVADGAEPLESDQAGEPAADVAESMESDQAGEPAADGAESMESDQDSVESAQPATDVPEAPPETEAVEQAPASGSEGEPQPDDDVEAPAAGGAEDPASQEDA